MLNKLQALLDNLEGDNQKGRSSSKSHLKAALYDWRVENQWNNENATVINYEDKSYAFITFTKREPRHCTIRHFFVLEDFRGLGIGEKVINLIREEMKKRNIAILRFFADTPSIGFYNKIGFNRWHGKSKTGLPFYYGDTEGNLISLPKSQCRYIL